jgi:hypothetical protein
VARVQAFSDPVLGTHVGVGEGRVPSPRRAARTHAWCPSARLCLNGGSRMVKGLMAKVGQFLVAIDTRVGGARDPERLHNAPMRVVAFVFLAALALGCGSSTPPFRWRDARR